MGGWRLNNLLPFIVFRLVRPLILASFALVPLLASPPKVVQATSIILISVDTLRADRLSSYGYQGHPTPHIDEFAKGGTLFSAISSQVPLTLPSHTCLLTSTYPFFNGVQDNGEKVPAHTLTLAEILKSHGYHTAAFVGGFVLDRRFGLSQGFDTYGSPFDLHKEGTKDIGDIKRLGGKVVDSATQWLKRNDSDPFFVFLHLYDLHNPYNVPSPYRERFGTGYEAELRYVDVEIGRLWAFLSQRGLLKNTLVVFTSDHGEGLGQHGESSHGYFLYQSTLWVPLIFHWPSTGKVNFPSRVRAPAGLVDVAPTILQFVGIAPPPQFQGRSLLGWLYSRSPQMNREVYSGSLYAHYHFDCSGLRSLRLGRYKYVDAPKQEFYDLDRDPQELHNLFSKRRPLALAYRERLLSFVSRFKGGHKASPQELSPETIARLSSLGYVAISSANPRPIESGADPKDRIRAYEKYSRAVKLASTGRIEQSNALLKELLSRYPELIDPRISLGWNYQEIGKRTQAVKEFRTALKNDPVNLVAHYDLGVTYFKLGQFQSAIEELYATLALAPYYTRAETLLGTALLQQGNNQKAEQHFHHILMIDPDDYVANYILGTLAVQDQHWDRAYQYLMAAVRIEPDNPAAHNTMGTYYLQRGHLNKAQQQFAKSIEIKPDFAIAHYNLGLVFQQQQQLVEAAKEFQQALSLDPGLRAARDAMKRFGPSEK